MATLISFSMMPAANRRSKSNKGTKYLFTKVQACTGLPPPSNSEYKQNNSNNKSNFWKRAEEINDATYTLEILTIKGRVNRKKILNLKSGGGVKMSLADFRDDDQESQICNTSNGVYTQEMMELAERLVGCSFADHVFFPHCGIGENEAAMKISRKYHQHLCSGSKGHGAEFITFSGSSFEGMSRGALTVTNIQYYRKLYELMMPGVTVLEYGDIEEAKKKIMSGKTAAVIVEAGEGEIYSATKEFLQALRTACDDVGALLIFDEGHCDLGRTGHIWAYEAYGVLPDIMTLSKPLAAQTLPIGACLVTKKVADAINYGDDDIVSAGMSLVFKVALKVLEKVQEPNFLANVGKKGIFFKDLLSQKLGGNPHVKDVRGLGLIIGIELDVPASPLVDACKEFGLIVQAAGNEGNVVRLAPPLSMSEEKLEHAVEILQQCLPSLDSDRNS